MKEVAGYLPAIIEEEIKIETLTFHQGDKPHDIKIPLLTPEQLNTVTDHVKQASDTVLKNMNISEIIYIIDQAIDRLLERRFHVRKKAEFWLPIVTGYDPEMVRLSLTSFLKTFRKPQLQRFLTEDFNNPLLLDDFQPRPKGGYAKAIGP